MQGPDQHADSPQIGQAIPVLSIPYGTWYEFKDLSSKLVEAEILWSSGKADRVKMSEEGLYCGRRRSGGFAYGGPNAHHRIGNIAAEQLFFFHHSLMTGSGVTGSLDADTSWVCRQRSSFLQESAFSIIDVWSGLQWRSTVFQLQVARFYFSHGNLIRLCSASSLSRRECDQARQPQ